MGEFDKQQLLSDIRDRLNTVDTEIAVRALGNHLLNRLHDAVSPPERAWDGVSLRPKAQLQHGGRPMTLRECAEAEAPAVEAAPNAEVRAFYFDRIRRGTVMAEGIKVHAATLEEAQTKAEALADNEDAEVRHRHEAPKRPELMDAMAADRAEVYAPPSSTAAITKAEHWRQWAIDGMPADKMRLAEETWKAAIESASSATFTPEVEFIKAFNTWYERDGSVGGLSQVVEEHSAALGKYASTDGKAKP